MTNREPSPVSYNFPASSLPDYLGRRKPIIENLDTRFILQQFHPQLNHAHKLYLQYLKNNLSLKYPKEEIKHSIASGDESSMKKIEQHISSHGRHREIQVTHSVFQSSPEKIISLISKFYRLLQKKFWQNAEEISAGH